MASREQQNKSIESFILNKSQNYVYTPADLAFFRKYDKCEDSELNENVVFGKLWQETTSMPQAIEAENRFNGDVLVTHGGSGKALTSAPMGASFHVMNNDYFCHEITRALTSGRQKENFVRYDFGSLAEYFYVGNTSGIPTYDLVITHPPATCRYAELDHDEMMADLGESDARTYYAVRSFAFVRQGGILMVIVPRQEYLKTHEKIVERLFHIEGATFDFDVPVDTGEEFILKYTRV